MPLSTSRAVSRGRVFFPGDLRRSESHQTKKNGTGVKLGEVIFLILIFLNLLPPSQRFFFVKLPGGFRFSFLVLSFLVLSFLVLSFSLRPQEKVGIILKDTLPNRSRWADIEAGEGNKNTPSDWTESRMNQVLGCPVRIKG